MSGAATACEPFAVADELTCYYDRPSEPANVHLEVRLAGQLDQAALRAAVGKLLGAEPGLLARRARTSPWRRRFRWEFVVWPDADPLQIASYRDLAELDRQRDAFVSVPPPLNSAPPFLLLLASGPDGDCLMLNAHHARFDGLACLRLMTELGTAYGQAAAQHRAPEPAADPAADPDTPDAGTLGHGGPGPDGNRNRRVELPGLWPDKATRRFRLGGTGRDPAGRPTRGPAVRIAPGPGLGGAQARPGYGTFLLTRGSDGLAAAARSADASVNDLLLAALVLTIAGWNASRAAAPRTGMIRITMPVGDRSQASRDGVWANRSRLTSVAVRPGCDADPAAVLAEVTGQTALAKKTALAKGAVHTDEAPVDALSVALTAVPVPVAVKHAALRAALRVAGPALCDTALLSNLGLADRPAFGDLVARELWFSTSAHLPRGLSLGAVSAGGRLNLTFRYRHALLSAADAAEFAGRYGTALDRLGAGKAVGV